ALYRQDLAPGEFEIIVVDDGSVPPVRLPSPLVPATQHLIRLPGVERSAARNAGATAARGKVLVFLDDDIVVNGSFLAAHLQAQRAWPGALVTGGIRLPRDQGQRPFVRFRQRLEDRGLPEGPGPTPVANFGAGGNLSVGRDRFLQLGGFDPQLPSSEDQDLA